MQQRYSTGEVQPGDAEVQQRYTGGEVQPEGREVQQDERGSLPEQEGTPGGTQGQAPAPTRSRCATCTHDKGECPQPRYSLAQCTAHVQPSRVLPRYKFIMKEVDMSPAGMGFIGGTDAEGQPLNDGGTPVSRSRSTPCGVGAVHTTGVSVRYCP